MNFYDFLEQIDVGLFGRFLMCKEYEIFNDLPILPNKYKLPIITDSYTVIDALNDMKKENNDIDKKYPNTDTLEFSFELNDYESDCFLLLLKFSSIFNYWFTDVFMKPELYHDEKLNIEYELLVDLIWDYLKGNAPINNLKKQSKKFYNLYALKVVNLCQNTDLK